MKLRRKKHLRIIVIETGTRVAASIFSKTWVLGTHRIVRIGLFNKVGIELVGGWVGIEQGVTFSKFIIFGE